MGDNRNFVWAGVYRVVAFDRG
ncbi:MAG: hypothetical protein QOJ19_545, partial [Acidimicrobiia bacterium]|nr:hypothetical protein [Acidimicrobiia bacterium]